MTRIIKRDEIRGASLDDDCRKARVVKNQYGPKDNRCYCYGLYNPMYDEILQKCLSCKAFCDNAVPPEEET